MFSAKWNADIRLTRADRFLAATFLKLIPSTVTPNHLTVLRMLLVLPTVLLLAREQYTWGIALFFLAGATDVLDGALARTRKQITEWGILFDPIADKFLIGAVLLLVVLRHVNVAIGIALLFVESLLIIGGWIRKRRGIIEPAGKWGKAKMAFESAGVLFLLIALASGRDLFVDLSQGTLVVALLTAIMSVFAKML
jgi:CDP-diacylglycerol--glycerol-3-phosphate 3-phosphatidyltransferase